MATTDTTLDHEVQDQKDAWSGGKAPFQASYGKLMMWYFLMSDAFTFGAFLISYGTVRAPVPASRNPHLFVVRSFADHLPVVRSTVIS